MNPQELRKKFSGVVAFPITPFSTDGTLDLPGLRRNLQHLFSHPPCAVVAAGGTGEIYSLTPEENVAVVRTVAEETAGRCPVIAGVGFNSALGAALAKNAAAAGADGILAFPPYYPQPEPDGIVDYYRAIADATPLGLIIYTRDWANYTPEMAERLASIPNLVAWKDGQGDIRRYQMIQNRLGDRFYWIGGAGDDLVSAYYSMGIRTFTSSVANVAPRLSWELHKLAAAADTKELPKLMRELVLPLYVMRGRRKGYEVSAMKSMMELIGLAGGPVRPPLVNLRPAERDEIAELLKRWKPWL